MNLTIQVEARELHAALQKAPVQTVTKLQGWVKRTTFRTERAAKTALRNDVSRGTSGRTLSSIHSTTSGLRGEVKPTVKYAKWVIGGRRPGKFPPFGDGSDLNQWARRMGMNPFLVARAIAKNGTKGHPFMDEAYDQVKSSAQNDADQTLSDIVRSI